MKRTLALLFALLFSLCVLKAQETPEFRQIAGKVVDGASNRPIHYASVNLAGTDVANVSNSEGVFTLKIDARTPDFALVTVGSIGYAAITLKISDFEGFTVDNPLRISLIPVSLTLDPALISARDPEELMKAALYKIRDNYPTEPVGMTAFYREMVKKGSNKYLTMNEAVLDIAKAPYGTFRSDRVGIYKGRGSQNYDSTDTLFIKYQGGAVSILQIDQAKNPFAAVAIQDIGTVYDFTLEPTTFLDTRAFYVVRFNQKKYVEEMLMRGLVYIDSETLAIGRVEMQMNVEGRQDAAQAFVLKRPQDTQFTVERADYVVNYKRSGDQKWYYDYARVEVVFKTKKKRSLFSNHYTVMSEIAVTDHKAGPVKIEQEARVRFRDQMTVKLSAFTDPNFWENYNVIEPDADIQAIVKKIVRQLKKHNME